jgi:hypothetical protein
MAPASPNDTRPTRLGRIDLAMQKFCQGKKARVCTVADSLENLMIAAHVVGKSDTCGLFSKEVIAANQL